MIGRLLWEWSGLMAMFAIVLLCIAAVVWLIRDVTRREVHDELGAELEHRLVEVRGSAATQVIPVMRSDPGAETVRLVPAQRRGEP